MDRVEKSLLLFLETAAVDQAGIYDPRCINNVERRIMDRWRAEGFIDHGRAASEHIKESSIVWVTLSPKAMRLAHEFRQERANRMWANRKWQTTSETRSKGVPVLTWTDYSTTPPTRKLDLTLWFAVELATGRVDAEPQLDLPGSGVEALNASLTPGWEWRPFRAVPVPDEFLRELNEATCCPFCGSRELAMSEVWTAESSTDSDNTCSLTEHQCRDDKCGKSFWI